MGGGDQRGKKSFSGILPSSKFSIKTSDPSNVPRTLLIGAQSIWAHRRAGALLERLATLEGVEVPVAVLEGFPPLGLPLM